jgi:hypothetical protein
VPCPAAEQTGCDMKFQDNRQANWHAHAMHTVEDDEGNTISVAEKEPTIACLYAETTGCRLRFRSDEYLNIHLRE